MCTFSVDSDRLCPSLTSNWKSYFEVDLKKKLITHNERENEVIVNYAYWRPVVVLCFDRLNRCIKVNLKCWGQEICIVFEGSYGWWLL